ncbi:MAG: hypothetical protein ACK2T4_07900 [Candidatus Promineifilaceae bacterium]|jgi:hypothetical protein
MNPIIVVAAIALLLILRLAVPCAVIGGLCFGLDRLFKRWDEEAKLNEALVTPK